MGMWLGVGFCVLMMVAIVFLIADDKQRGRREADTMRRLGVLEREHQSIKKQVGWVDDRAYTVRFPVPRAVSRPPPLPPDGDSLRLCPASEPSASSVSTPATPDSNCSSKK